MPWWAWLFLGWAGAALVCALWWGRALAHAERQERLRRHATAVEQCEVPGEAGRRPDAASSARHARRPILHRGHTRSG